MIYWQVIANDFTVKPTDIFYSADSEDIDQTARMRRLI